VEIKGVKMKKVCAVCGKDDDVVLTHKLPHGSLNLCRSSSCFEMFCALTQGSVPIVWVGKDDYIEHEVLTREELKGNKNLRPLIEGARAVADYVCNDSFWEGFNEGLWHSVDEFEKQIIRDTPRDQLPLLIGHLKHGNDKYLAEKIKGE
jgi:hypothetical protein